MRVLITGITGFVGGHLAELLLAEGGHTVTGFTESGDWPTRLTHLAGKAELLAADLLDPAAVRRLVERVRPDWVFHLAGYANTGKSKQEPEVCRRLNVDGSRVLFESVVDSGLQSRVLAASTGLVYGDPDPGRPAIDETTTLKPATPYAASKVAADTLANEFHRSAGLDVLVVRLFNMIGPRQQTGYAVPDWAVQVVAAERGRQEPVLRTGDLSARRDFTDVRDMVVALRRVIEAGQPGEVYNAGRGEVWQMRAVAERLAALAKVPVRVEGKADPTRPPDAAVSKADPRKLIAATGWQPRFTIEQTLADVLESWRTSPQEQAP